MSQDLSAMSMLKDTRLVDLLAGVESPSLEGRRTWQLVGLARSSIRRLVMQRFRSASGCDQGGSVRLVSSHSHKTHLRPNSLRTDSLLVIVESLA